MRKRWEMFERKDLVVYGATGVCEVVDIGTPQIEGIDKERIYYTLHPVYSNEGVIYTPVDNTSVAMRHVMSAYNANELINSLNDLEPMKPDNMKQWETECKEAMRQCDSRTCCRIVKTLYFRKMRRLASGRKSTTMDERYLHNTGEHLFGELAVALGRSKEEVTDCVLKKLDDSYKGIVR
jgi:CarD family transcriptional regulator